jgi:carotenoid cleavage dioxygenase
MSKPMPDHPFLTGNFAPWPMEGEIADVIVEGEIPAALRGSYFRNGSNPQFAPRPGYHWFSGDGMIHALHFAEGRCRYQNRFVRTARFEAEAAVGEAIFGGFGAEADPRSEGISGNASNTHVMWHAGRLLSLWEAGPPHEIDPKNLDTRGIHDYEGAFARERFGAVSPDIMTAHPKLDPDTGEWIGFGYSPMPPHLVYHSVDREGRLSRSDEIDVPFPSMMHDFAVSAEHVIFPVFPAAFDFEAMQKTGSPIAWQPERGTHIGVMPRDGNNEDVVWLDMDPCFAFHFANAQSSGSQVLVDVWQLPAVGLFPTDEQTPLAPPRLHRWTIDLEARTLRSELLDDAPAEFGRIDDRQAGKDYRHLFSLGSIGVEGMMGAPSGFNCLFHYDMKTGGRREHRLPMNDVAGEPVFVPSSPDAAEGEGFVLALVYRSAENRSDAIVLDAQKIEAPPLATIKLPHRIPFGFHGSYVDARSMAAG